MTRQEQLAWAAGIIEADGTLTRNRGYAVIAVEMADEDIIRELSDIFPNTSVWGPKAPYTRQAVKSSKPTWRWSVRQQQRVLEILAEIRPYLHSRRGAKADVLVEEILQRSDK